MKKFFGYILFLSLLLIQSLSAGAVTAARDTLTARTVFEKLQIPALKPLDSSMRLDMLDYYSEGKSFAAATDLGARVTLDSLTTRFASLTLSSVSTMQILVVPAGNKNELALIIYTLDSDGADSELIVADASMRILQSNKYFKAPVLADFIPGADKKLLASLNELMPFFTASYSFLSADPPVMEVTPTVESLMSIEAYDKLKPYITNADGSPRTLRYAWTGKALRPQVTVK